MYFGNHKPMDRSSHTFLRNAMLLGILLFVAQCNAQLMTMNRNAGNWNQRSTTLSGGLQFGIPVGDFKETFGHALVGFSGNVSFPMRRLPLEFGYDFAWARMGGETKQPSSGGLFSTSSNSNPKVQVSSNVYDHLGFVRLNPSYGRLRPYGDLLGGARHFATRTVVTTSDQHQSKEKDGSLAFCYGWAVGVMYGLKSNVYAELRVERLITGQVSYVDPRSVGIANDGSVSYQKLTSNVDVVNIQMGLGFRF